MSCLLSEGPGNEQNAWSFLLSNRSLQSLNCVPSQDSSLSQCLLSSLSPSLILLPVWRGEEWHKVYLAEHYRCAAELIVIDASVSWSPASYESGHWVPYGSGQILFWGLLLHSAQLRGILHLCDLFSLLSSFQIGPKIPKLFLQC